MYFFLALSSLLILTLSLNVSTLFLQFFSSTGYLFPDLHHFLFLSRCSFFIFIIITSLLFSVCLFFSSLTSTGSTPFVLRILLLFFPIPYLCSSSSHLILCSILSFIHPCLPPTPCPFLFALHFFHFVVTK